MCAAGLKNGEKKLRSLMQRVDEWDDQASREHAAKLAQGEGRENLAEAIRKKNAPGTGDEHMNDSDNAERDVYISKRNVCLLSRRARRLAQSTPRLPGENLAVQERYLEGEEDLFVHTSAIGSGKRARKLSCTVWWCAGGMERDVVSCSLLVRGYSNAHSLARVSMPTLPGFSSLLSSRLSSTWS